MISIKNATMKYKLGIGLVLMTLLIGSWVFAIETVEEAGEEAGQKEIEIIHGVLDFDGFIVLVLAVGSAIMIVFSTKIGGIIGKFLKILLFGVIIIGVNISFGDLWDPISLNNPFIDDIEDLLEIIGFLIIGIAAHIFYKDMNSIRKNAVKNK